MTAPNDLRSRAADYLEAIHRATEVEDLERLLEQVRNEALEEAKSACMAVVRDQGRYGGQRAAVACAEAIDALKRGGK